METSAQISDFRQYSSALPRGAGPCGQRSALPIPIGLRIAVKSPNGYPDGQNRRSFGECRLAHMDRISESMSLASQLFRPVTDLDR
jgi:hypothetical protein